MELGVREHISASAVARDLSGRSHERPRVLAVRCPEECERAKEKHEKDAYLDPAKVGGFFFFRVLFPNGCGSGCGSRYGAERGWRGWKDGWVLRGSQPFTFTRWEMAGVRKMAYHGGPKRNTSTKRYPTWRFDTDC